MKTSPLTILMKVLRVIGLLITSIGAFALSTIRRLIINVYTWSTYLHGFALSRRSPWQDLREYIPQWLRSTLVILGPIAIEPTPILPNPPEQYLIPSSPGSTTSSTRTERTRTPSPILRRPITPLPSISTDDQDFEGMGDVIEDDNSDSSSYA
jgi:hypothetical protein